MDALIVDDSGIIRKRIADILIDCGFKKIYEAEKTEKAKEINKEHRVSVVISEIYLEKKSQINFLAELKRDNPYCKIIVLTNSTSFFHEKKSIDLGADFFIDKSTEVDKLVRLIKSLNKKAPEK